MRPYLDAAILLAIAFVAIVILTRIWLNKKARQEVYGAPKIPMVSCDKHGLIPKDAMLVTTAIAVGRPDLAVEHCPICYGERLENVKGTLAK
jgi:hypothetical protein